jgi:GMP synthase-like glutamine amidotransferase
MKPVLLVRNDEHETYGIAPGALARAGLDVRTVNMTAPGTELPPLAEIAGLVMFGGVMNVDETERFPFLADVREATREALERDLPYLGICLGSQLMVRALGTPVARSPVREIGFEPIRPTAAAGDDALLSLYSDGDPVFEWHEDTYDLPEGATLLATGDRIGVQAFRFGETAWGIQFHQELDASELEWWIRLSETELDLWGTSAAELRAGSEVSMRAHEERGLELFRRFAEVVREHTTA